MSRPRMRILSGVYVRGGFPSISTGAFLFPEAVAGDAMKEFAVQELTLGQVLDTAVGAFPLGEAVVHPASGVRWTWLELSERVDAVARGLMAIGVDEGEKIALWAPNCPQWIVFMFAAAKIGAVLLTVNTNYQETELRYLLRQSGCGTLVFFQGLHGRDFAASLHAAVPEVLEHPRGALHSRHAPELRRIVAFGDAPVKATAYSLSELDALGRDVSETAYAARRDAVEPYAIANMQYTSGTTGFPKGVMLTHVGIVNNARCVGGNLSLTAADRVCLPVPLFHCVGCVLGVLACAFYGVTMVLLDTFSPVPAMNAVARERCTALYGVPSFFQAVLHHRFFPRFEFGTLRTGIMAGAVCPEELMRAVMTSMGMEGITICYGLTEGSPVLTQTRMDDSVDRRVSTVGRSLPGIEVSIRDRNCNTELPRGEVGEVCCRGYNVMRGYYDMPEATAEVIDDHGWLHTGDLGCMDADGYVSIRGRIKDMIIRGGENVYPREVEDYLRTMDGVLDVQIVGVPSERYGEEVGAFLIVREGADVSPETVRAFCRGRIAWYKIPRHFALVREFPLTANGKVQKYKLREMAERYFVTADA